MSRIYSQADVYGQKGHEVKSLLIDILGQNLDFHDQDSLYASHNYHSFPAKFPPQLPRLFIEKLTKPSDVILDPMMGSGTTVVEAISTGRKAIGFDIDPLSILLTSVKVAPLDRQEVKQWGTQVMRQAIAATRTPQKLAEQLDTIWDEQSRKFVDYWFAPETQLELLALANAIHEVKHASVRRFLQLVFSSIIITKSGGVSLAFDLAHTRPHRAKIVFSSTGQLLWGSEYLDSATPRIRLLTKTLRSPLKEFEKRLERNLSSLSGISKGEYSAAIQYGDAQHLALPSNTIDLIITSPPYISNAIDYMRAHKFSLVWLGYPISKLGHMRRQYIGGEATTNIAFVDLPPITQSIIAKIEQEDRRKSLIVHRYYSEMTRILGELYRVLKPKKVAIVVVGTSIVKGMDTHISDCLSEIGQVIGFEVPSIGIRNLDRNRRMLPASRKGNRTSQIEQRIHEEYVIGFYKP